MDLLLSANSYLGQNPIDSAENLLLLLKIGILMKLQIKLLELVSAMLPPAIHSGGIRSKDSSGDSARNPISNFSTGSLLGFLQ